MRRTFIRKKSGFIFSLAGVLAAVGIFGASAVWATPTSGVAIKAEGNIRVREEAVDGAQVGSLTEGQEVTITGEKTGSDGKSWYSITFTRNGSEQEGWVREDLIDTTVDTTDEDDQDAENTEDADTSTERTDASEAGTTDADEDEEDTDADAATDEDAQSVETAVSVTGAVRFELNVGYVDLEDVPEDIAATVSDRYVVSECTLQDGTVSGYQLASPDELVSDDAVLINYYYLYGTNEIGESGWYVYDASQQSLMKSTENMSYSLSDSSAEETSQFETDSVVRMIMAVLGVVCVLLLILAIAFSIRYRRLSKMLEKEMEEEERLFESERERRRKAQRAEKDRQTGTADSKQSKNKTKQKSAVKKEESVEGASKTKKSRGNEEVSKRPEREASTNRSARKSAEENEAKQAAQIAAEEKVADRVAKGTAGTMSDQAVQKREDETVPEQFARRGEDEVTPDRAARKSERETMSEQSARKSAEDKTSDRKVKQPFKNKKQEEKTPQSNVSQLDDLGNHDPDIMDLDEMDDADFEAMLGLYLDTHLNSADDTPQGEANPMAADTLEQTSTPEEPALGDAFSRNASSVADEDMDEPEFYDEEDDDDDDDLEFL